MASPSSATVGEDGPGGQVSLNTSSGNVIRVLTQNMNCHYLNVRSGLKRERVAVLCKELARFDVVLLQEMFTVGLGPLSTGWTETVIEEACKHGLLFSAFGGTGGWMLGQDSGLVVLSRFPIASKGEVIRDSNWTDPGTLKGAIFADIDIHGTVVRFYDLHLDARTAERRRGQYRRLHEHCSACELPHLLAGDWNIHLSSEPGSEYQMFRATFCGDDDDASVYKSVFENFDEPMVTHDAGLCIDHVLSSKELLPAFVGDGKLSEFRCSDHLGIEFSLDVSRVAEDASE
jgi:endonuclease/exonuclease/phosphatase family metal-dependent hydrolase